MSHVTDMIPSTEELMVRLFVKLLRSKNSPWNATGILQEFNYLRGRTDVVVTTDDSTIAIEAKLSNWRRALDQAYRNTCFAEESYVLLPPDRARYVMKYVTEFEVRGVGLCCVNQGRLEFLHKSPPKPPIEPALRAHVRRLATG